MLVGVFSLLARREAFGYRPFDSTDADVAEPRELELELGPVGFVGSARQHILVAPSVIFNVGIGRNWELVLQGRHFILLQNRPDESRFQLVETGLFLKGVLRRGSLQNGRGPNVAVEIGPLLPSVGGERGMGATATAIVSQRWRAATLHVNAAATLTRAGNFDLFGGIIVEGPARWRVRPVTEVFVEREFNDTFAYSGLVGAIWRARDSLSFDAGFRSARVNDETVFEVRAGLTWATPLPRVR